MKYRVNLTKDANARLPRHQRDELINRALRTAEGLKMEEGDTPVINIETFRVRVLIKMQEHEVWVMTNEEAERGGLPSGPSFPNDLLPPIQENL